MTVKELREEAAKKREEAASYYRSAQFAGIEYAGLVACGAEAESKAQELERQANEAAGTTAAY